MQFQRRVVHLDHVIAEPREIDRGHHRGVGLGQIQRMHVLEFDRLLGIEAVLPHRLAHGPPHGPGPAGGHLDAGGVEPLGRIAEPLVHQQHADQFVPRINRLLGVLPASGPVARVVLGVLRRHQRPRLELDERRGHHEEVARDLHVDGPHVAEEGQVLVRDPCDRDVVDVELRPTNQVEQQVQRTLEGIEGDSVILLQRHPGMIPGQGADRGGSSGRDSPHRRSGGGRRLRPGRSPRRVRRTGGRARGGRPWGPVPRHRRRPGGPAPCATSSRRCRRCGGGP